MKRLILTALLALNLNAADVLVTPNGKTYHATKCMALSHSKEIHPVTLEAAKGHGLRECGICYRAKSAKKAKNNDWMKGATK